MGKMHTYLIVISGLLVLSYYFGIYTTGVMPKLMDLLIKQADNFENSPMSLKILYGLLGTLGAGGVVAAALTFGERFKAALNAVAVLYLISIGADMLFLFASIKNAMGNAIFATILMSPMVYMFVLTCYEWFRETD